MELKGSKTEQNLKATFAGESQAASKYTCFASAAKEEDLGQAATLFLNTAEDEIEHAKKALDFLKGVGNTGANLKAAADGEHYEWTEAYVDFERVAREEGFDEIADFFKDAAKMERQHEVKFNAWADIHGSA
jgi:rubrerythrin